MLDGTHRLYEFGRGRTHRSNNKSGTASGSRLSKYVEGSSLLTSSLIRQTVKLAPGKCALSRCISVKSVDERDHAAADPDAFHQVKDACDP
jgi:hypothetical protein